MARIKAGYSGRLIRNGTMKNEFSCNACGLPPCIKVCGLSINWPKNCMNTKQRKEVEKREREEIKKAA